MKVKVAQSCPTLCDPMDYIVRGILQARILEWVAFPFSGGSSQARDWTQVSHFARGFFTNWATICIYMCVCVCMYIYTHVVFVQPLSCIHLFVNSWKCSIPGPPSPYHLPEFVQIHVHCIGDAIQPSHPLMPSSPSALNLSQHQELFQWIVCSHQMTKILELQLQHQCFQQVFRIDFP